ncbi:MAG: gamma carbonic anhydrase family protein, partial [Candidatus Cloacimonetes bacterium]|nr:gamma carbonic anhydrase family protein [Candidatus Cloacimonadota bacterium]
MILSYKEFTPKIGKNTFIAPTADIIGRCEIGNDCSIWFGVVIRGDVHYIKIGDRSNVQDLSMIHVSHYKKEDMSDGFPTVIGSDVTIGHRVMLHGCKIEDACII